LENKANPKEKSIMPQLSLQYPSLGFQSPKMYHLSHNTFYNSTKNTRENEEPTRFATTHFDKGISSSPTK
jgi:hypothetical protein